MNEPLHNLSALDLNKAFIEGQVRAVDIAAYFLDRIQRHNKALGAFLSILEERAILQAKLSIVNDPRTNPSANSPQFPSRSKIICTS